MQASELRVTTHQLASCRLGLSRVEPSQKQDLEIVLIVVLAATTGTSSQIPIIMSCLLLGWVAAFGDSKPDRRQEHLQVFTRLTPESEQT